MCIRDRLLGGVLTEALSWHWIFFVNLPIGVVTAVMAGRVPVSYTHLRAHETVLDIVCRLLLEKKKPTISKPHNEYSHKNNHRYTITH